MYASSLGNVFECNVLLGSLSVYRKQCCWDWSSSRGGPCSWGARCRTSIRPQESTWGQVQSHPGLNCPANSPSLPPLMSELIFIFFFPKQEIPPIYLYHRNLDDQQTPFSSTPPSALFWYLFFGSRFVLFLLFVYFDRSTLCICMCMVQSLPLSLQCVISAGRGTRITFLISTNDSHTLTLLQQHKL